MEKYEGLNDEEIVNSMKWFSAVRPLTWKEAYWLAERAEELATIKRLLNDIHRFGKGGQLHVDGKAYKVDYLCEMDDLD